MNRQRRKQIEKAFELIGEAEDIRDQDGEKREV